MNETTYVSSLSEHSTVMIKVYVLCISTCSVDMPIISTVSEY